MLKKLIPLILLGDFAFPAPVVAANYYFASAGRDGNNSCKSQDAPCQTIAKASSIIFGQNDNLLFNGGDNFLGCLNLTFRTVHSSANAPLTVKSYGSANATLTSNCSGAGKGLIVIDGVNGVNVMNLTLRSGSATYYGVLVQNTSSALSGNITLENLDISGFTAVSSGGHNEGGEINLRGFQTNCNGLTDIRILNNTLHGASISAPDESGIAGEGCTAGAKPPNVANVLAQGNHVYYMGGNSVELSGDGILLASTYNSTEQFNLAHDNGYNVSSTGGPVGIWFVSSTNSTTQFNEVFAMQPGSATKATDFDGYDCDIGSVDCLQQYLYSHDNYGYGFAWVANVNTAGAWGPNTLRYSISENDTKRVGDATAGVIAFFGGSASGAVINVYNNTVWTNTPSTAGQRPVGFGMQSGLPAGVFHNNIIAMTPDQYGYNNFIGCAKQAISGSSMSFKNNYYFAIDGKGKFVAYYCGGATNYTSFSEWQANAPSGDTNSVSNAVNPGLAGGGSGRTLPWIANSTMSWPPRGGPSGYVLKNGAPARSAGIKSPASIKSPGSRDYYGNPVPGVDGCYNIGAYGVCP